VWDLYSPRPNTTLMNDCGRDNLTVMEAMLKMKKTEIGDGE
jgi:hypothetical protein